MTSLNITIAGQPFEHMVFHFVLTYSNWESVTVCHSESSELPYLRSAFHTDAR